MSACVAFELVLSTPRGESAANPLLEARAFWIGRDPSCDLVLDSEVVSRRHARVTLAAGRVELEDCSANGCELDGTLLHRSRAAISERSCVAIGPYRLALRTRSDSRPKLATRTDSNADSNANADRSSVPIEVPPALRRQIHRALLDHLDLARCDPARFDAAALRPKVVAALDMLCRREITALSDAAARAALVHELTDEALGLGPLEALLAEDDVGEIMVVDPETIYVERCGRIERTALRFTDAETVRSVIERIITPLGRRIDESTPLCDARLPDGSRVNAIIPPLASRGPCITIRKFARQRPDLAQLCDRGSLSRQMLAFLAAAVRARKNIVIAGGTGSGKTTLLNALSAAIPEHERIVTIEDAAELRLQQEHVVALEARPPNMEGKGAYSIRDLVRNALRMRPDRIIVGECRGGEAIDMLQAMNTGHEGSMTTTHANSPLEAVARIETLCLMAGLSLPIAAIRQQIAQSLHLIVQQTRFADGARRVTRISELARIDEQGEIVVYDIFGYEPSPGMGQGEFRASGYLPSFAGELERDGFDAWGGGA